MDDPPGILAVCCPCPLAFLSLGAAFAAYPDSKSDMEGILVSCLCLPRMVLRGKTGLGAFTFDRVVVLSSCSLSEAGGGGANAVLASSSTPVAGIKSW